MQNELKRIEDHTLHLNTLNLASSERALNEKMLWHLREVDRRRLYLQYDCGSLFEYCTKQLKYSEGSASRRVNAARLLLDVPEAAEQLKDGSLNMSNLNKLQSFVRAEEKRTGRRLPASQKRALVKKIENKSQQQAQVALAEVLPMPPTPPERKPVSQEEIEFRFRVGKEFMEKFERVRELRSHKSEIDPKLFEALLDEYIARHAPEKKPVRKDSKPKSSKMTPEAKPAFAAPTQSFAAAESNKRRAIPVATVRALHQRSNSCCEWVNKQTGHRCERRYHLQIDHIVPKSRGGNDLLENLQLICRPHNLNKGARLM